MDPIDTFRSKILGKKIGGRLENWRIVRYTDYEIVYGEVYGDDRWFDGYLIHTSPIIEINEDETLLITRNTFYELGERTVIPE